MSKISSSEAARRLNVSRRTVLNWVYSGRLNAEKLDGPLGPYVIDTAEVERVRREIEPHPTLPLQRTGSDS